VVDLILNRLGLPAWICDIINFYSQGPNLAGLTTAPTEFFGRRSRGVISGSDATEIPR
jgi:hypothetical protein